MARGRDDGDLPEGSVGGVAEVPIERVTKRDGRVVPFKLDKIAAAIAAALEATGRAEPSFASEVASVVELALIEERRRDADAIPHIEGIQDLVERALMELGRPEAAKAYILYRDRRARIRATLHVHRSDALQAPVRVRETEGVSAWSKGRLVAALIEEAELPRPGAEEVAAAVERRVLASGLSRITTGLVRELVAGELLERGWTRALASTGVVGMSRHDLRRALRGESLDEWERTSSSSVAESAEFEPGEFGNRRIEAEVLRRHALDEILPGGPGELHRAGDLHVEDLGAPHRALSVCVDAGLLGSGGSSASAAFAALDGVAELARRVSRVLVLEKPATLLTPLLRGTRAGSPLGLPAWLQALGALARGAGIRIELGSPGTRFTSLTARLVEALAELGDDPLAPTLSLDGHELERLLAEHPELAVPVDRLLGRGRLCTSWSEEDESYAGPGIRRRRREPGILSCGGAVALNLPRLARRAGPWREELVQSGLAELVQAALEIAGALDGFQRAHDPFRAAGLHARRSFAIVPVGLRESLFILGDGEIDPDLGARLLGLVAEAARRFSSGTVPIVAPASAFGGRAARRFAWLDERRARAGGHQRWLFSEAEGRAPDTPPSYTPDLHLSPIQNTAAGRFEAEALRTIPSGVLSMAGLAGPADTSETTPHLSAWRRFEVLRRARAGEIVLELFPTDSSSRPRRTPTLRPLA